MTRCATDGTRNAGSALYARAREAAHALGVHAVTYTLLEESGASLRGAGWIEEGVLDGSREWSRVRRARAASSLDRGGRRWWCCVAARPGLSIAADKPPAPCG